MSIKKTYDFGIFVRRSHRDSDNGRTRPLLNFQIPNFGKFPGQNKFPNRKVIRHLLKMILSFYLQHKISHSWGPLFCNVTLIF